MSRIKRDWSDYMAQDSRKCSGPQLRASRNSTVDAVKGSDNPMSARMVAAFALACSAVAELAYIAHVLTTIQPFHAGSIRLWQSRQWLLLQRTYSIVDA